MIFLWETWFSCNLHLAEKDEDSPLENCKTSSHSSAASQYLFLQTFQFDHHTPPHPSTGSVMTGDILKGVEGGGGVLMTARWKLQETFLCCTALQICVPVWSRKKIYDFHVTVNMTNGFCSMWSPALNSSHWLHSIEKLVSKDGTDSHHNQYQIHFPWNWKAPEFKCSHRLFIIIPPAPRLFFGNRWAVPAALRMCVHSGLAYARAEFTCKTSQYIEI